LPSVVLINVIVPSVVAPFLRLLQVSTIHFHFFHFFFSEKFEQKVEGQRHRVSIEGRGRAHCVACGATTDSLMTFAEMASV
jgi:hypothetical protein